jgi:hypothetical protein
MMCFDRLMRELMRNFLMSSRGQVRQGWDGEHSEITAAPQIKSRTLQIHFSTDNQRKGYKYWSIESVPLLMSFTHSINDYLQNQNHPSFCQGAPSVTLYI